MLMNKAKPILQFFCLFIAHALLFFILAWCLPIRFEENDDVAMCMIANGTFTGVPNCHLVFQNALWGCLLVGLYTLTSGIEWYSILFALLSVSSASIIVWTVLKKTQQSKTTKVLFLLVVYLLWLRTVQSFQFTTIAALTCIAGVLMLICYRKHWIWIIGGGYIVCASLIRFNAAGLVGLMMVPLILWINKKKWKEYVRMAIVLAVVLLAKASDKAFYLEEDWKYFSEYNVARGQINDNPNTLSIDELNRIGVSGNDYALLRSFFPDPNIMTLPVVKSIRDALANEPFSAKMKNVSQIVQYRIPLALVLLMAIMLFYDVDDHKERYFIVGLIVLLFAVAVGLCINNSFKNRVFLSMLLATVVSLAFFPLRGNKRWGVGILDFCLVMMMAKYSNQFYKHAQSTNGKIMVWNDYQYPLLTSLPQNAFIANFGMITEGMSPFDVHKFQYKLYPSGWDTNFPPLMEASDSHQCLLKADVFVFTGVDKDISLVEKGLLEHYDIVVEKHVVAENDKYAIIQIAEKNVSCFSNE